MSKSIEIYVKQESGTYEILYPKTLANLVSFTPKNQITATNVQGAIEQVATKANTNTSTVSGLQTQVSTLQTQVNNKITYGTSSLTAGSSSLTTGTIYLVYE